MIRTRTMMKHIAIILAILAAVFFLGSCGSKEAAPEDRVYLEENEFDAALADGNAYKGKWIKIVGKAFNVDKDGETIAIQAWHDPKDANQPFIVYGSQDDVGSVSEDDYILVDGEIAGVFTGENMLGGEVKNLMINAESVQTGTYDELYAPAETTKTIEESQDQHGVKVTLDRIEYAKDEARVYIIVNNSSGYTASIYTFNAKAIQDGKQFEHEDNYEVGYDDMGEILDGASKDGIIRFRGLDPDKPVKIQLEAYSDNFDITLDDFVFEVK